jgi:hypothetical protein
MPRLYTYQGFLFSIYSNDHVNPHHVHVTKAGTKVKVEFRKRSGLEEIKMVEIAGRFSETDRNDIMKFASKYRRRIIGKINDYLIRSIKPLNETINQKTK